MTELVFPVITDDDGSGKSGTPANAAWAAAVKAAIDLLIHSPTNPTMTPAQALDELETARGAKPTLNDRLSTVLDPDGNFIPPASAVSQSTIQQGIGSSINLVKNSTFFLASKGLALAPDYWSVANGSVLLTGVDEPDTTRKVGKKAVRLTWVSGLASLSQALIPAASFVNLDHLKSAKIAFGAWVKASIANHAQIGISDGASETFSMFHSGLGDWEWLSGVHSMSAAATEPKFKVQLNQAGSCYLSGAVACLSSLAPAGWFPEQVIRGSANLELPGVFTVGDGKKYLHFARPVRIDAIQMFAAQGPTGAALTVDFERKRAGSWLSMIGGPQTLLADGDEFGDIQPTGDYTLRCLSGMHVASGDIAGAGGDDALARLNIDVVGSTFAGADAFLRIDGVQCIHPFEDQLAFATIG